MVNCSISEGIYLFLFFNQLLIIVMAYLGLRIERHNASLMFVMMGIGIMVSLALSTLLLHVTGVVA